MISMRMAVKAIITVAGFAVSSAHAAPVLLEKITQPGFTTPAYAVAKTCKISIDGKLVQTYAIGAAGSTRSTQLILSNGIGGIINEAAKGVISTSNGPVDTPTIIYNAYQIAAGHSTKVILSSHNGGTGQIKENGSDAALLLKNFINLNCGDAIEY
jgi:hypothetical protein